MSTLEKRKRKVEFSRNVKRNLEVTTNVQISTYPHTYF